MVFQSGYVLLNTLFLGRRQGLRMEMSRVLLSMTGLAVSSDLENSARLSKKVNWDSRVSEDWEEC